MYEIDIFTMFINSNHRYLDTNHHFPVYEKQNRTLAILPDSEVSVVVEGNPEASAAERLLLHQHPLLALDG